MEITIEKKAKKHYQNHHSLISYVYQNRTRCRFNIYGLKNSTTFAEYLIDKLRNEDGIRNIRPSTITGNLLIEFDPQNIGHKELFKRLETAVILFTKSESFNSNVIAFSSPHQQNKLAARMLPAGKSLPDQCNHDCKSCSNRCFGQTFNYVNNAINMNHLISFACKTTGSLILQRIAKRFIRQSLYRLIF